MKGYEKVDTSGEFYLRAGDVICLEGNSITMPESQVPSFWSFMRCSLKIGAELWQPVPEVEVLAESNGSRYVLRDGKVVYQYRGLNEWVDCGNTVCAVIDTLRARLATIEAQRPLEVGDRVRNAARNECGEIIGLWVKLDSNLTGVFQPASLTRIEAKP